MYDRYTDVQEHLDRALLARSEPPCHQTAREQLTQAGIKVEEIIRALPEAILFVNEQGVVMTAWSEMRDYPQGSAVFYCERGMPAFPFGTPDAG